jgi:hypothetical protein
MDLRLNDLRRYAYCHCSSEYVFGDNRICADESAFADHHAVFQNNPGKRDTKSLPILIHPLSWVSK